MPLCLCQGTGLGLAFVAEIVRAHGGEVTVTSGAWRDLLSCDTPPDESSLMAVILIIDDNETIRDGLTHTIKKMGHDVVAASSGQ